MDGHLHFQAPYARKARAGHVSTAGTPDVLARRGARGRHDAVAPAVVHVLAAVEGRRPRQRAGARRHRRAGAHDGLMV